MKPKTKGRFPWFLLLFVGCFFGVFHQHRGHSISTPDTPVPPHVLDGRVESLPQDALQAIQPSEDARWDGGGDVSLDIYNGSQWTVTKLDLEIQITQGYHAVRQVYRTSVNASPLQPLTSEYVTVHTALPRLYEGSTVKYRVVGAMGSRPG